MYALVIGMTTGRCYLSKLACSEAFSFIQVQWVRCEEYFYYQTRKSELEFRLSRH